MASGRSALIVATSRYTDARLATLDGPARDAEALKGVLSAADIGGFDVRTVINGRAARIREALEAFLQDRSRDDVLVVHFSGHGLKDDDGQLYLAATDTKLDRLMSTGIDAGWVNRLMDRCRSERIGLFLDCCFAGAFTSAMTRRAGGDTAGVKDHFGGRGLVVITASDAMQYSFEGGRQVGEPPAPSPFSQALVDGLRTGAADRNEDGHVSINELFDYLEERVRETSPAQTPTKSAVNQTGDWVIARSTRVPSVRLLPERVQLLLRSEQPIDRLEAIMELGRLRAAPDERTAQAATAALRGLTADDSRRVAQRAAEALGDEPAVETAVATPAQPAREPAPAVLEPTPPVQESTSAVQESTSPVQESAPAEAAPAEPISTVLEPTPQAGETAPAEAVAADRGSAPTEPIRAEPVPAEPVAVVIEEDAVPTPATDSGQPATHLPSRDSAQGVARGLLGTLIGVAIALVLGPALQITESATGAQVLGIVVGLTIAASVIELARLRLRGKQVPLWTALAGNRWTEAVSVGVMMGLVAAALAAVIANLEFFGNLPFLAVTQVAGFLVAEAIVGLVRPHPAPRSAAH